MVNFLENHLSSIISYIFGGGGLILYITERKKNKALTSQEISKADQDKITTAEKTIDLMEKLRSTMDRKFMEMEAEINDLRSELKMYIVQCEKCENNKITRK